MKALLVKEWGRPEDLVIEYVPSPPPGPGEVRVAVHAIGINFADTVMIAGNYQLRPPRPFSPGFEAAGEVVEVGAEVENVKPGDRVGLFCNWGAYAEEVVAPADRVFLLPDKMDFTTAAAFFIAYSTSHVALTRRGRLQPGETLLVHGAAGGVGLTAVELGKLMGATVIATASTQKKLDLAAAYGADHTINYTEGPFYKQVLRLTGGDGANVIYDPVGGDAFDQSVRCIAWEGRLLIVGFASGVVPQLPANYTLVKNFDAAGFFWGSYAEMNPKVISDSVETLLTWYQEGKLKPHISHIYPMADAADALNLLINRKSTGRVVLTTR